MAPKGIIKQGFRQKPDKCTFAGIGILDPLISNSRINLVSMG